MSNLENERNQDSQHPMPQNGLKGALYAATDQYGHPVYTFQPSLGVPSFPQVENKEPFMWSNLQTPSTYIHNPPPIIGRVSTGNNSYHAHSSQHNNFTSHNSNGYGSPYSPNINGSISTTPQMNINPSPFQPFLFESLDHINPPLNGPVNYTSNPSSLHVASSMTNSPSSTPHSPTIDQSQQDANCSYTKWKQKEDQKARKKQDSKTQKNIKERQRRSRMTDSLQQLRDLVPQCSHSKKIDHSTIMMYTVSYIHSLNKRIKQLEMENRSLKETVPPNVASQIQQQAKVEMNNLMPDIEEVGDWPLYHNSALKSQPNIPNSPDNSMSPSFQNNLYSFKGDQSDGDDDESLYTSSKFDLPQTSSINDSNNTSNNTNNISSFLEETTNNTDKQNSIQSQKNN